MYVLQLDRFERLWLCDRPRYDEFPSWDEAVTRFDAVLNEPPRPLSETELVMRELGVA